jgi:osmotically-inducible protein OsmY
MTTSRFILITSLLVLGCQARDGDTMRQVARKTGEKLDPASRPVNALTTGMRGSLGEASVTARVEARLRWDRYLSEHSITVQGDGKGTVTLSGTVPEPGIKTRAVDLAKSTVGVESVNDEITVSKPD